MVAVSTSATRAFITPLKRKRYDEDELMRTGMYESGSEQWQKVTSTSQSFQHILVGTTDFSFGEVTTDSCVESSIDSIHHDMPPVTNMKKRCFSGQCQQQTIFDFDIRKEQMATMIIAPTPSVVSEDTALDVFSLQSSFHSANDASMRAIFREEESDISVKFCGRSVPPLFDFNNDETENITLSESNGKGGEMGGISTVSLKQPTLTSSPRIKSILRVSSNPAESNDVIYEEEAVSSAGLLGKESGLMETPCSGPRYVSYVERSWTEEWNEIDKLERGNAGQWPLTPGHILAVVVSSIGGDEVFVRRVLQLLRNCFI